MHGSNKNKKDPTYKSIPVWTSNVPGEYMDSENLSEAQCFKTFIFTEVSSYWTHWGWDIMAAILETTYSTSFSRMRIVAFWFKFHWYLSPRIMLTKRQLVMLMVCRRAGTKPLNETRVDYSRDEYTLPRRDECYFLWGALSFSVWRGIWAGFGHIWFVYSLTNNAIIEYAGNHNGRVVCPLIQWHHNWDDVTKCVLIDLNRSFKISTIRFLIHQISGCVSEQYSRKGIPNYGEKYRTNKKRDIGQHGRLIGCILHFEIDTVVYTVEQIAQQDTSTHKWIN